MIVYNEIEPFALAWLEELVLLGAIPHGVLDGRPIQTLDGGALRGARQFHTFCGIGGWPLALELAGWPADLPVWTGSCPCQPFSSAGKGEGENDPRHLWPAFRLLIERERPPVVFGEQVASAAGRLWLSRVRADLEALGYEFGGADLCSAGVGAPHIRQRLFWVADLPVDRRQEYVGRPGTGEESDAAHCGGGSGRAADCNGDGRSEFGLPSPDEQGAPGYQPYGRGEPGNGVAEPLHPERQSLDVHREDGRYGEDDRREEAYGESRARGQIHHGLAGSERAGVRLSESRGDRREEEEVSGEVREQRLRPDAGAVRGGKSPRAGPHPGRRRARPRSGREEAGIGEDGERRRRPSSCGAWSDSYLVPCSDGTARRVGRGVFPLAYGIPRDLGRGEPRLRGVARSASSNRRGRLKGFGNAINPVLAAEFIGAYMEARGIA